MKHQRIATRIACLSMLTLIASACSSDAPENAQSNHTEAAAAPSNQVAIPLAVRSNLGITFVGVERRRIEQTLRVPGRFEYLPTARREFRTMLPGRIEILVGQFQAVEAGTPLYRIDSPAWRAKQQQLAQAGATIDQLRTKLDTFGPLLAAHDIHESSLKKSVEVWNERVEQLETVRQAGGGRASELVEARSSLAAYSAEFADIREKHAQLDASQAETRSALSAARTIMGLRLDAASSLLAVNRSVITEIAPSGIPYWQTVDQIEVRAAERGIVETIPLTNGAWADEKALVLSIARPDMLRFRASALQSDLGVLKDGLDARIVPPTPTASGRAIHLNNTMQGTINLGLAGDANDRTIDLFMTPDNLADWARPGVTAQLEIVTDSTAQAGLAIPLASVQRDGLVPVIFRRNPKDPNAATRLEADLGKDDGRWIAVESGLREGDQVVLDGAFQLMLATSGSVQKGGHFHADGTFHEGED